MNKLAFSVLGGSILFTAFAACSAASPGSGFTTSAGGGGSGGAGPTTTTTTGSSAAQGTGGDDLFDAGMSDGSGGGAPGDCSEAAKLVYVVGTGNELYSFSPQTLLFKPIGILNCPSGGLAQPFSMAVDRSGTAWVLYNDGHLFNVSTANAACTPTAFVPNQHPDFSLFGMGFVADSPGSAAETLYIGSYTGVGVGKIDLQTLKVSQVGAYDTISGAAEITGNGDGHLFAFFSASPVVVAEIDKTNSHVISKAPQPSVQIGSGWAFAFWGGDFWLFTSPGFSSQVDRYRPSNGTTMTVALNVGFTIVGAGVSTCAPVKPPS